ELACRTEINGVEIRGRGLGERRRDCRSRRRAVGRGVDAVVSPIRDVVEQLLVAQEPVPGGAEPRVVYDQGRIVSPAAQSAWPPGDQTQIVVLFDDRRPNITEGVVDQRIRA